MTHWSKNPIAMAIIAGSVREALKLQEDRPTDSRKDDRESADEGTPKAGQ